MSNVFGLCSDLHFHDWAAFSEDDEHGVNMRFRGLLSELKRCAEETKAAGGKRIYCAGDVFHTRNQLSPLILNPVIDTFKELVEQGFEFRIISGNHDLARRDSERLSSAVTALEMPGVTIANEAIGFNDDNVMMIPWFDKVADLEGQINAAASIMDKENPPTLIIHAPVNGVIPGLPDTGIDPAWLAGLGFKRVFSGHYHAHKAFPGEVYSIGALAHHTWSDVGTKAGFLIISDDEVKFFKSRLPEFLDLDQLSAFDPAEIPLLVDGNYVRVKTELSKASDIEKMRKELVDWGAKGTLIRSMPKAKVERKSGIATSISGGASITKSVVDYVNAQPFKNKDRVNDECAKVIAEAGVVA